MNTKFEIKDTFCSCLDKWFGGRNVDANDYPEKFLDAIKSQILIGWRHIFNGKLSVEQLKLQGNTKTENGEIRADYIWGAAIVEQHSIT